MTGHAVWPRLSGRWRAAAQPRRGARRPAYSGPAAAGPAAGQWLPARCFCRNRFHPRWPGPPRAGYAGLAVSPYGTAWPCLVLPPDPESQAWDQGIISRGMG
ncbi:hypothetical protein G6F57_022836 [Rhizopus arrhizus]|nr:hypothetical protein G6F57_022836 [Rhizopus arrhizus]